MPNWRKEEEYAFTDKLTPEGWAWEFLRRSPDYRKDYESVKKTVQEERIKYGPKQSFFLNQEIPNKVYYEPERLDGESLNQWIKRCLAQGKEPRRYNPESWFARKWDLIASMASPDEDKPAIHFTVPVIEPDIVQWDSMDEYFDNDESNYQQRQEKVVLAFDLTRPITPQLRAAKKIINQKAKQFGYDKKSGQGPRARKNKWKMYLRVLDAEFEGAVPKEMASILFPQKANDAGGEYSGTKSVNDSLDAAHHMCQQGYSTCLLLNT